jgi:hypothetical protein
VTREQTRPTDRVRVRHVPVDTDARPMELNQSKVTRTSGRSNPVPPLGARCNAPDYDRPPACPRPRGSDLSPMEPLATPGGETTHPADRCELRRALSYAIASAQTGDACSYYTASRRSVFCTDGSSTGGRSSRPCRITDPDETISRAYVCVRQVAK